MKNSTQINCLVLSVLIVFFNKMFNHKNVTTILNLITNIDIKNLLFIYSEGPVAAHLQCLHWPPGGDTLESRVQYIECFSFSR